MASDSHALASSRRWLEPRSTVLPAPSSSSSVSFQALIEEIESREVTTKGRTSEIASAARASVSVGLTPPPPPPSSRRTIPGLHETVITPADPANDGDELDETRPFDRRLLAGNAFISEPELPVASFAEPPEAPARPAPPPAPPPVALASATASFAPVTLDGATWVLSTRVAQQTVKLVVVRDHADPAPARGSLRATVVSMLATVVGVAAVVALSLEPSSTKLLASAGLGGHAASAAPEARELSLLRGRTLAIGTPAQDAPPLVAPPPAPRPRRRAPRPSPVVAAPAIPSSATEGAAATPPEDTPPPLPPVPATGSPAGAGAIGL